MKTAMQELLDHLESYDMNINTEFYKGLIEKEKEQIIDAYNQGTLDGESSMLEYPNYYNQTYNQNNL